MERGDRSIPDWRYSAAYAPLVHADRAILAWEWLRRVPGYRAAAAGVGSRESCAAGAWGLHRFEDPDRAAPFARPIWTAAAFDAVLRAETTPSEESGAELTRLRGLSTVMSDGAAVHLLLSDGWRAIRLDLTDGHALDGPVRFQFRITGPPGLAAPLLALRRLDSLLRLGCFAQALHRPEPRARRRLLVLRAADALALGASQRDLAAVLLDPAAAQTAWREERPDLRLRAQRLARDARAMLAGGYRTLLLRRP
jgi:hypothetical protein